MNEAGCLSHAFWLDPLCVPLNSTWKRRALEKMDEVYKQAAKVIVIDRDVIRCRGNNVFKRIVLLMSDWITRLWTLQEAFLPGKRLWVVFADGVKSLDAIVTDYYSDSDGLSSGTSIIHTTTTSCLQTNIMFLQSIISTKGTSLIDFVEAFHRRQATKTEDEFICLAILLGLNVRELPEVPTMQNIITRVPSIQQDIIFAPGPRCTQVGFRWCPSSVVAAERRKGYEPRQSNGVLGRRGIKVQKDIARIGSLAFQGLTLRSPFADKQRLCLKCSLDLSIVVFCEDGLGSTATQLQPRLLHDAALIFEKPCDIITEAGAAILVSNFRTRDNTFCCRYECIVMTVNHDLFSTTSTLSPKDSIIMNVELLRGTEVWVD